ncbi:MAG: response regulator [Bacteroidota bacterium]
MKPTVLVIEDDADILDNLQEILELKGLEVYTATNGQEGLQLASEVKPDLIISDVMMPSMDGFEMLDALRRVSGETAMVPFIFLTARAQTIDQLRGAAAGADRYLIKPFDTPSLLQAVRECLLLKWEL